MNPATGTFITQDTYAGAIFDPTSLHKYLYANANPVMNVDPSGHSFISDFGDKAKNAMQKIVFNTAVNKIVNAVGKAVNVLTNTIASKSNVDNKKHLDAPGCTKERFSPGCSGCNSVVVVAREGKTNDENKRFNATITVYSLDGTKTDFVGSTLPDNIYGTYDDGRGHAKVKPGIYSIEIGEDHCKSRAYNVKTTTGGWFVPCQRWDGNNWYDDTADGILIHRAEDGPTSKPWSTGCITIEGYLEYDSYGIPHDPTMEKFAELVGSSAILIIER